MTYLIKLIKSLLALLLVLVLHALVLWQIVQHTQEKRIVQQPPKPIMVSFITPPVVKKILVKKTEPKIVTKPKLAKKVKIKKAKPKKVKIKKAKPKKVKIKKAKPKKVKIKKVRKAKLAKIAKARKAKLAKARQAKLEKARKAKFEKARQAKLEKARKAKLEKARQAKLAKARKAKLAKARKAKLERARQAKLEKARKAKLKKGVTTAPSYKAAYLHNPHPAYSRLSKRRREQGTVLLRVKVAKNGRANSIIIRRSSGYNRLDQAARRAVQKWRFIPAKKNGKIVSSWVNVPIVFKLN